MIGAFLGERITLYDWKVQSPPNVPTSWHKTITKLSALYQSTEALGKLDLKCTEGTNEDKMGWETTADVLATKFDRLMLLGQAIAIYCENRMKDTIPLRVQNA
jgi:hypothetical protein